MEHKKQSKISKFLSYLLRHHPEDAGLEMDSAGWVSVDELLAACKRKNHTISREELEFVVANCNKKRFEFGEEGNKIRASQGHSIEIDLEYKPADPPEILYHGTATRNKEVILAAGLKKMQRHHVHLSPDQKTAVIVGTRYGKPLLFQVLAQKMQQAGHTFFCSTNGVWLTEHVPPEFLKLD